MLSCVENPESLSYVGLVRYRVVTDRQTYRITIASTRLALLRAVGVSCVKSTRGRKLQFSDIYSCKFPREEIMAVQMVILPLSFLKIGLLPQSVYFWTNIF